MNRGKLKIGILSMKTGDVANLQIPTLCIVGGDSEDEVTAATTFKQLNKNIHIAVIPFAGHLVHNDQPKFIRIYCLISYRTRKLLVEYKDFWV